jgi:diguanylate cyclase (GGDEF)-like protein
MSLDIPTLFIVSTCIAGLLGLFLFFAWIRDRNIRALAWWGGAYLFGGLGVALWMSEAAVSPPLPYGAANALLFIACGMIWNGARLFQGRSVHPFGLFAGAGIWLIACQFPLLTQSGNHRVVLSSLIVSVYTFCSARELWRERRDRLRSQWAAIFVPVLHGLVFLPPIPLAFMRPGEQGDSFISAGWMAVFTLETLLYSVGTAFIVLILAKERVVQIHKTAAVTDILTGLFNRRGFLEQTQALIDRHSAEDRVLNVLMFDLDHFKSINDRFGHSLGDEALAVFAATIKANMRAKDIIGRLGGEEFAAVVPSTPAEAEMVAERVRAAFEIAGMQVAGRPVAATVSIGAASAAMAGCDVRHLLSRADAALYVAKAGGRNRLAWAPDEPAAPKGEPARSFGAADASQWPRATLATAVNPI